DNDSAADYEGIRRYEYTQGVVLDEGEEIMGYVSDDGDHLDEKHSNSGSSNNTSSKSRGDSGLAANSTGQLIATATRVATNFLAQTELEATLSLRIRAASAGWTLCIAVTV